MNKYIKFILAIMLYLFSMGAYCLSPHSGLRKVTEFSFDKEYVSYFAPLEDTEDLKYFINVITEYNKHPEKFPAIDKAIKQGVAVLESDEFLNILNLLAKGEDVSQRYAPEDIVIAKLIFFNALAEEWHGIGEMKDVRFNGSGIFPALILSKALGYEYLPNLKSFFKSSLINKADNFEARFTSDFLNDNVEFIFAEFCKDNPEMATNINIKEVLRENKIVLRGDKKQIYEFRKYFKNYKSSEFPDISDLRYIDGKIKNATVMNARNSFILDAIATEIFKNKERIKFKINGFDIKNANSVHEIKQFIFYYLYDVRKPQLTDIQDKDDKAVAFFGASKQLKNIEDSYPMLLKNTVQIKNPDYITMSQEQKAKREVIKNWGKITEVFNKIDVNNYKVKGLNNTEKFDLKFMARDLFALFNEKDLVTSYFMGSNTDELYLLLDHSVITIKVGGRESMIKYMSSDPDKMKLIDIEKKGLENKDITLDIITRDDFFKVLYKSVKANYNFNIAKIKRLINHIPGRFTPLILMSEGGMRYYLKGTNVSFLRIDQINHYFEDIFHAGVKFVRAVRNVSDGFLFFFYDQAMMLFNHIEGNVIQNINTVSDKLLGEIMNEANKLWNIDVSQYNPQKTLINGTSSKIIKAAKDPSLSREKKYQLREFADEFETIKSDIADLPVQMLHGDLHLNNVEIIEDTQELVGFIDPRPMVGPRIVDVLKWVIPRDDPKKHQWYFSNELLKKSLKHLDKQYRSGNLKGEPFTPKELKVLSVLLRTHFLLDFALQKTMSAEKNEFTLKQLDMLEDLYSYSANENEIYRLMMDRDYVEPISNNSPVNKSA